MSLKEEKSFLESLRGIFKKLYTQNVGLGTHRWIPNIQKLWAEHSTIYEVLELCQHLGLDSPQADP